MPEIVSTVAMKILGKSLDEIFKSATGRFQTAGAKWKNESARKRLATKVITAQKVKTFWQRDKPVDLKTFGSSGLSVGENRVSIKRRGLFS